jgi:hypothetical protein
LPLLLRGTQEIHVDYLAVVAAVVGKRYTTVFCHFTAPPAPVQYRHCTSGGRCLLSAGRPAPSSVLMKQQGRARSAQPCLRLAVFKCRPTEIRTGLAKLIYNAMHLR